MADAVQKDALQGSSAGEATDTHVFGQGLEKPAAPAKVKTEKELERERKKAEKQAKFEQKKAAQAQAAAADSN